MECLDTKEDAINLVKSVFQSMGGRVLPPRRPRHIDKYEILTIARDNFMMDFENEILKDWDARQVIPNGPHRFENSEWAALVKRNVFPHHSDVDWEEYVEWVQNGGGDEWFQEDEDEDDEDEEDEEEEALFCKRHQAGPLDVWYDCDACVREVRDGPAPCGRRYVRMPLSSIHAIHARANNSFIVRD